MNNSDIGLHDNIMVSVEALFSDSIVVIQSLVQRDTGSKVIIAPKPDSVGANRYHKEKTFSSTQRVPAVGNDMLHGVMPNCRGALAGDFAAPVMEGYQAYQQTRGKLIVPIPQLEVI